MGRGLGLAVLGGVVGALIWGAIAYFTGWSIGIIALIVGTLVGVGMQVGIKGRGTVGTGLAAAAIALASIIAAKFVVAQAVAGDWVEKASQVSEEDAIDQYASEVYDAFEATGQYMSDPEDAGLWPPEVMAEAERLWEETPQHERDEYMAAISRDAARDAEEGRFGAGLLLFVVSFGPINLIILGVAIATAYRTGRNSNEVSDQVTYTPQADANGLVGGPLSRSGPTSGNSQAAPHMQRPQAKPQKPAKPADPDEEDSHGAGIFARLAAIEEGEKKKAEERRNAA
ncbi:MAG TPA: hypothetical protein VHN77_12100 [Phycisphaerales bacterium]|nr:hypothetical protein [Phycisphaerales bacterium]